MHLFLFGYGFTAAALAARVRAVGGTVAGTVRDPARAAALSGPGVALHAFGAGHRLDPACLAGTTHLVSSVPPEAHGDPVLADLGSAIAALSGTCRWIGYLSTTGVYGDHAGGWVDETTPPAAQSPRARRRVEAEAAWQRLGVQSGIPVHVFRLAGIYGPGRSQIDALRAGTARRIVKPGQVFSRIHVEDIAAVLLASMARPRAGAIYNVCDDEPAPPDEVVAHAAALLGMPPPPAEPYEEAQASLSEMGRSFYAESKRVRNRLIREELGVTLRYPTYREGLAALARP